LRVVRVFLTVVCIAERGYGFITGLSQRGS
jgi:hypothetical protein